MRSDALRRGRTRRRFLQFRRVQVRVHSYLNGRDHYSDPLTHNTGRQMATLGAEEGAGVPDKETPVDM
jgi:hypothetical protein